jgi:hypothetical protein
VVAHLTDVEARMSAHLWRLTTALESLDYVAVQRQVQALDALATESGSPRVRFFAASRRGMQALLVGDLTLAARMRTVAQEAGDAAGEPDTEAITHTLTAGIARQADDRATLAAEAASFEAFGTAEGVASVAAEAALLWLAAGDADRARGLLGALAGPAFATIARDVDWLYTVSMLTEVAAGTAARDLAAAGLAALEPYAGRGIVNGGAVAFAGVVDDVLRRAALSLGHPAEAQRWGEAAAAAYDRLGAAWWRRRVGSSAAPVSGTRTFHLRPGAGGVWTIGADAATWSLRDMKGLHYLRLLLAQPGVEVAALDLSSQVAATPGVLEAGLGELVDRQAIAAYRARLADLDAEIEEAREWADTGRLARAQDERDALVHHLAAAAGLGGRQRLIGGSAERARVAVRKAIAAAVERIDGQDATLARLLRDTVRTGLICCYDPDPDRPVIWQLDGG